MTYMHVKSGGEPIATGSKWSLAAGTVTLRADKPARGLWQWLRVLVLRRDADAMLKRTLGRPRRSRLDELSPYLLRDIGLPPDTRL